MSNARMSDLHHGKPERFTAKRKRQAVQRLMSGESREAVSGHLGVTVAQVSELPDDALASAKAGLKPVRAISRTTSSCVSRTSRAT